MNWSPSNMDSLVCCPTIAWIACYPSGYKDLELGEVATLLCVSLRRVRRVACPLRQLFGPAFFARLLVLGCSPLSCIFCAMNEIRVWESQNERLCPSFSNGLTLRLSLAFDVPPKLNSAERCGRPPLGNVSSAFTRTLTSNTCKGRHLLNLDVWCVVACAGRGCDNHLRGCWGKRLLPSAGK